jgi:shikimate dehydrogenase
VSVPRPATAADATRLAGPPPRALVLLGHPVAHSLSPRFQQAALDAAGFAVRYTGRDVTPGQLTMVLRQVREEALAGNVTIPHKEAVAAACDVLTPVARRAGAVNTFGLDAEGRLVGHNTDVDGVRHALRALRAAGRPDGAAGLGPVVVLGAGGSAAAVLLALESLGAGAVTVVTRTPSRAEALVARLAPALPVAVVGDADSGAAPATEVWATAALVINATPRGLHDGDPWPVDPDRLAPRAAVLDLVYRTGASAWVRAVRARGHRAEDGLPVLVEQGAAAFAWWFGVPPDRQAMWHALGEPPTVMPW